MDAAEKLTHRDVAGLEHIGWNLVAGSAPRLLAEGVGWNRTSFIVALERSAVSEWIAKISEKI